MRRLLAAAAGIIVCACAPHPSPSSEAVILAVPGAENSGVSIAASANVVVAAWAATQGESTNVYAAVSQDDGRSFGVPVRVNDIDGDARVSGEQAPRVAVGREIAVVWVSRRTGVSQVRLARSSDGGRTFLSAETEHDQSLTGARGWPSVTLDRAGAVHIAWLDGRENSAPAATAPAGGGHAGHAMHGSTRQDIFAMVREPDGSRSETAVAANVCFCCKTAIAEGPNGSMYVAWRNIYPTNLRDIAIARSRHGGRTFGAAVRVSEDHWALDACPEDGPSIGVGDDAVVHVAWPTIVDAATGRKGIFYSASADGAATFSPRLRLDAATDTSAHPQLAVSAGGAAVVWESTADGGHAVRVRRVRFTRRSTPVPDDVVSLPSPGRPQYPAIATVRDGAVIAWTDVSATGSVVRVQRVR